MEPVSSTRIRHYLNNGEINTANLLLGYNYNFSGKVIKGNNVGRKLGFPTANIDVKDHYKLIPPYGVYAVLVDWNGKMFNGMLYIGNRPTIPSAKFCY